MGVLMGALQCKSLMAFCFSVLGFMRECEVEERFVRKPRMVAQRVRGAHAFNELRKAFAGTSHSDWEESTLYPSLPVLLKYLPGCIRQTPRHAQLSVRWLPRDPLP